MNFLKRTIPHLSKVTFLLVTLACLTTSSANAQDLQGATLGGYGELHYNDVTYNANGEQTPGNLDFHRFIIYAGYRFNDWISFQSELELEHTLLEAEDGGAEGGEVAL